MSRSSQVIDLPFDPNLALGPLRLTWHAFFALLGMAVGVAVGVRLARPFATFDQAYAIGLVGVVGGLAGSRLFHVLDAWPHYAADPASALAVWDGGASIVGGAIGGPLAGGLMALRLRVPLGRTLDVGAVGLGVGMAIGRIGDIVNGEHHATACDGLPWCVRYTHPATHGQREYVHPAVAYEMAWDIVAATIALYLVPRAERLGLRGRVMFVFLGIYGVGRFFISFLRLDATWLVGLRQAQVVSLAFVAVAAIAVIAGRSRGSPYPRSG